MSNFIKYNKKGDLYLNFHDKWLGNVKKRFSKDVRNHGGILADLNEEAEREYKEILRKFRIEIISRVYKNDSFNIGGGGGVFKIRYREGIFQNYSIPKNYTIKYTHSLAVHPLNAIIVQQSNNFPDFLIDSTRYRKMGFLEMKELMKLMKKDANKAEFHIKKKWYPNVIKIITGYESNINTSRIFRIHLKKSVSVIISREIDQIMERSIKHVADVMEDESKCPLLNIHVAVKNCKCVMEPSCDDIYFSYEYVLETANNLTWNVDALSILLAKCGEKNASENNRVKIKRNKNFMQEILTKLRFRTQMLFQKIREKVELIENSFFDLLNAELHGEREPSESETYEHLFGVIKSFQNFHQMVLDMPSYEEFQIGRLCLEKCKQHLQRKCEKHIKELASIIGSRLLIENRKLWTEYDYLRIATTKKCETSDEILAAKKLITYAEINFVKYNREKISAIMKILINLMSVTIVNDELAAANANLVKSSFQIEAIINNYIQVYETSLISKEEMMAKETDEINEKLDNFFPELTFLNNIDTIENILEDLQYVGILLRKLDAFEEKIQMINEEERKFNKHPSTYPELDELKNITWPFSKLLTECSKWVMIRQNIELENQNAWANDFIRIKIQRDVDGIRETLLGMRVFYRTKCKQHATENYKHRFKGIVDDPDVNCWPAPLKVIQSCLENMNNCQFPWKRN